MVTTTWLQDWRLPNERTWARWWKLFITQVSVKFPYRWPQKHKGLKDPFSLFFFSVPKFDLLIPLSGEQFRHALVRVDKFVEWMKIESQKNTCKVGTGLWKLRSLKVIQGLCAEQFLFVCSRSKVKVLVYYPKNKTRRKDLCLCLVGGSKKPKTKKSLNMWENGKWITGE